MFDNCTISISKVLSLLHQYFVRKKLENMEMPVTNHECDLLDEVPIVLYHVYSFFHSRGKIITFEV